MASHNQAAHDRYNSERHPRRPFGSQVGGKHVGTIERCPRIGRTRRLMSEPPCPACGNKSAWRCECEIGDEA
jgi:hypothetical protein